MQSRTAREAKDILKQYGISATCQRISVLLELLSRQDHPRAEDIYTGLLQAGHFLSRATVYNTLNLFSRHGLLKALHIETESLRYDVEMDEHSHFLCEGCGRIFNVRTHIPPVEAEDLKGFSVRQQELTFRGLCPSCSPSSGQLIKNEKEKTT